MTGERGVLFLTTRPRDQSTETSAGQSGGKYTHSSSLLPVLRLFVSSFLSILSVLALADRANSARVCSAETPR